MPLQTGSWTANVGGVPTQIQITGMDGQGNVSGNISGNSFSGFWNEDSQRITFLLAPLTVGENLSIQIFVGYLFTDPVNLTGASGTVFFTLTGYVEDFLTGVTANPAPPGLIGPPPSAKCSLFGWYAQIGVD